jgi:hypothetical protein
MVSAPQNLLFPSVLAAVFGDAGLPWQGSFIIHRLGREIESHGVEIRRREYRTTRPHFLLALASPRFSGFSVASNAQDQQCPDLALLEASAAMSSKVASYPWPIPGWVVEFRILLIKLMPLQRPLAAGLALRVSRMASVENERWLRITRVGAPNPKSHSRADSYQGLKKYTRSESVSPRRPVCSQK